MEQEQQLPPAPAGNVSGAGAEDAGMDWTNMMFEQAAIGIAHTALNGQILRANQRFCAILDRPEDEVRGQSFEALTFPDDLPVNREHVRKLLTGDERSFCLEKRFVRRDGSPIWTRVTVSLLRTASGEPLYFGAFIEDISAEKDAEREHARLRAAGRAARSEAEQHAQQLHTVFDTMTDGVAIYDSAGQLVEMNHTLRKLLGMGDEREYSQSDQRARWAKLRIRDEHHRPIPTDRLAITRIVHGETLSGTRAQDAWVTTLDGRAIQLSCSGAPILDVDGRFTGAVAVFRDVTERKLLERRTRDALDALLEMAETLVRGPAAGTPEHVEAGEQGIHVPTIARHLAELALRVTGCQRATMYRLDTVHNVLYPLAIAGFAPEDERRWWHDRRAGVVLDVTDDRASFERFRGGEAVLLDTTQRPQRSTSNPVNVRVALDVPMRVGTELVGVLNFVPGSEDHHFTPDEIALAGAVAQLTALLVERERLLGEREAARASALALQEANRRMDEFLGIASHELRTPLTAIKANLQLLERTLARRSSEGPPVAPLKHGQPGRDVLLVERSQRQVLRLERLVDDLVDVSRIRTGKLELRLAAADLVEIARDAVEEERLTHPDRTLTLEVAAEGPLLISADASRIEQVITNYLTNALRYTPEEAPISVRVSSDAGCARVSVTDQGPGIASDEQSRIWDVFHRTPGIETQSGSGVGLGLGLHISKTIIERHGGTVGVESVPGAGSTFWCTLPLLPVATERALRR